MLTYNGKKLFRERESMSKSLCIVINEMAIWLFLDRIERFKSHEHIADTISLGNGWK